MAHSKRLQDKTLQSYLSLPVDVVTEYNFLIQDLSTACVNRSHSLYKQTQDPLRAALLNLHALLLNFLPSSPPNSHSPCHSAFLLTLGKIAGVEIDGLQAMFMICWESHEDILIKKGSQFEEEDARKNTQKKRKKLKESTAGLNITLHFLHSTFTLLFVFCLFVHLFGLVLVFCLFLTPLTFFIILSWAVMPYSSLLTLIHVFAPQSLSITLLKFSLC